MIVECTGTAGKACSLHRWRGWCGGVAATAAAAASGRDGIEYLASTFESFKSLINDSKRILLNDTSEYTWI